jgi:hypothetical protein
VGTQSAKVKEVKRNRYKIAQKEVEIVEHARQVSGGNKRMAGVVAFGVALVAIIIGLVAYVSSGGNMQIPDSSDIQAGISFIQSQAQKSMEDTLITGENMVLKDSQTEISDIINLPMNGSNGVGDESHPTEPFSTLTHSNKLELLDLFMEEY